MLTKKNALISMAVVLALAACGGGGSDSDAAASITPPGNTTPPPGGNTPPPATGEEQNVMGGHLLLVGDQVLFNGIGITTAQFATGAFGFAKGTNFPLQTFGLRLMPVEMAIQAGQSQRARLAFEMVDAAAAGRQAVQLMINQVDIAVDANGTWTVSVPSTATLYAYARDAAGTSANLAVTNLPAGLISLSDISGDPTSKGLTINLDAALGAVVAGATGEQLTTFQKVVGFTGDFTLRSTLSNVEVRSQTGNTELVGDSITVTGSGQTAVSGAGVEGLLKIE
jgi:hypothetical protein